MTKNRGEDAFAIETIERIGIRVTDARRHDFHQDLASLGTFQVQLHDLKGLFGFESDGGAGFHSISSIRNDIAPLSTRPIGR